jgi:hypothetical protein
MLLDVSLLRRARIENIERLAKALGLPVKGLPVGSSTKAGYGGRGGDAGSGYSAAPRGRAAYQSQLVNAVMRELKRDAMRAEFERLGRM